MKQKPRTETWKCDVCGRTEKSELDLSIEHRGCRLKRAFPNCYEKKGGLLFFDTKKIMKEVEKRKKKAKP